MSERTLRAAAGLIAAAGVVVAVAVSSADGEERPAPEPAGLRVTSTPAVGAVVPGGAVTGTLQLENRGTEPVSVTDVAFAPAVSDGCARTGVVLAPTVPPTPEAPVRIRGGGTATLGWTAYMDGTAEQACQGATLTSRVVLDGGATGAVTLTAGVLQPPPAPAGGLTTSTRAAVRWSASTATPSEWVLERAVAGTADWQPACGSSPQRPLRTLSCTDAGLVKATAYLYRVTLRTGQWQATSPPSAAVTTQQRPSA